MLKPTKRLTSMKRMTSTKPSRPALALRPLRPLHKQAGATLLEVLVAMLLLTSGMLAMAWQHAVAVKYEKMSQFRAVSSQIASDMADRIRANVGAAPSYVFVQAYTPGVVAAAPADCMVKVCTGAEMAAYDVAEFRNTTRRSLPDGSLFINQDPADPAAMTVWVLWRDPEAVDTATQATSLARLCPAAIGTPAPMPQCLPLRVLL